MTDLDLFDRHARREDHASRVAAAVEVRDPSAATQQVQWIAHGNPMIPEWDAEAAIRHGYLANVIAYRCVQIYAQTIAAVPFRAGPDIDKRTTFDSRAPLAKLLGPAPNGPAPKLSARKLLAWTFAQRIVTGRFAWELELDKAKQIVNLWPLASSNLKAIPTDSGTDWFRAFTYGRPDNPKKLSTDQVFYGWTPSQLDFRQPESALQASRYDLSIAVMGDRYSYAFLKNGAVPATLVLTDKFPNAEAFESFKMNWRGVYQGPDNAGKTHFAEAPPGDAKLEDFLVIKQLGITQKDAQFLQQHKEAMEHVAWSLGVPWSKIDASGRTFDNADHEDRTWWESSVLPKITEFEDEVNMDLAPRVGSDAGWFDLTTVRALRPARRLTALDSVAAQLQWIAGNEWREDVGLPAMDGLDEPTEIPEPAALPAGGSGGAVDDGTKGGETGGAGSASAERDVELRGSPRRGEDRAPDATQIEARRASIWKRNDAVVQTLEGQWRSGWRRLFARQARSVLQALTGKRGVKMLAELRADVQPALAVDPSAVFNRHYWAAETADFTESLYEAVASAGAARISALFAVDFDLASPFARDFIAARSNQLAGGVTQTTYDAISKQLSDGVSAGESIDDLSKRIRDVFDIATKSRAETIARTEVVSAYNGSAQLFATQLPADVVGGQEWIATRDGRTREEHAAADGQTTPMSEPFNVGGEALMYPGDPQGDPANTVNCRCTIAFLTPEEMGAAQSDRSVSIGAARAVLAMVQPGHDELTIRRALRHAKEDAA